MIRNSDPKNSRSGKMFRILTTGIRWYYGCYIEDKKGVPDEGTGDVDYGGLQRLGRGHLDHLAQTL